MLHFSTCVKGLIFIKCTPPISLFIHANSRLASEATTREERPLVASWASFPAVILRPCLLGAFCIVALVGGLCVVTFIV